MKISVVVPLYNSGATVRRALESVLSQTFLPKEIIIVNDGSTDNSLQEIGKISSSLISTLTQPNSGVSYARNKGVEIAKGDWIAFLDADDIWFKDHIETFNALSDKFPECQVLAGAYIMQDYNGSRKNIILNSVPFTGEEGIMENYFEVASSSHPPIHASSMAVKKSALLSVGGFPVGIKSGEDLLTWARLAIKNRIAYSLHPISIFLMDPAHSYEKKPNRLPQTPDTVGNELSELSRSNKNIPGLRNYTSHWFKMRASVFLRLSMRKQAACEILKSIAYNPLNFRIYSYFLLLVLPTDIINQVFKKSGNP